MMWITGIGILIIGFMLGIAYSATQIAPVMKQNRREIFEDFAETVADIVRAKDDEIRKLEQIIRDNV